MKVAAWVRPIQQALDERLASQPTQSRLMDILTLTPGNRAAHSARLSNVICVPASGDHAARKVTVDIDSFQNQIHGQQPDAAYNGHYKETAYHPLAASYSTAGNCDRMQEGHRLANGFVHAISR